MGNNPTPKGSGPNNKLLMAGLAFGAVIVIIIGGFLLFGAIGGMIGGAAGAGGIIVWLILWATKNMRSKPLLDLEKSAQMDIIESTMLADLPTPAPLKTYAKWSHNTCMAHPGDVFGRTKLPVDDEFYTLIGIDKDKDDSAKTNTVWAFRMRMLHKPWSPFNRNDQYIALVCQSQIHPDCLGPDGDIQFNSPIIAKGAGWSKYGSFYILWNDAKELALAQAAVNTVKALVALKEQDNRLAESAQANARTNVDIIHNIESGKGVVDVITGE